VTGGNYQHAVYRPWREMKTTFVGGVQSPMHASGGHLAPGAGDSYIGLLNFRGETDPLGAPEHENRANLVPTTRSQTSN
jgi:hypothetical protein